MSEPLFGTGSMSLMLLLAAVAVIIILALLLVWGLRRRGRIAFMRGGSNRQPRLAVLDAAAVDARRRLVLVRRDGIEHLLMIGGPSDIVVERGINRVAASARLGSEAAAAQPATANPTSPLRAHQQRQPKPPQRPQAPQPETAAAEKADAIRSSKVDVPETRQNAKPPPEPQTMPPPTPAATDTSHSKPHSSATGTKDLPLQSESPAAATATAAAVAAATASAGSQMTAADEPQPDESAETPLKASGEQDTPAEPEIATAGIPDEESAIKAEIESALAATGKSIVQESPSDPEEADRILVAMQNADQNLSAPEGSDPAEEIQNLYIDDRPPEVAAQELIADFDELLEAEISKAARLTEPKTPLDAETDLPDEVKPEPPEPHTGTEPAAASASLEDEMKKLLGDLSVKP